MWFVQGQLKHQHQKPQGVKRLVLSDQQECGWRNASNYSMRRFYSDKLSLRVHSAWEVTWSLTCYCQMFIWGLATDVSGKMCWAHCESSCQWHERGVDIHTGMCSTLIHVNCFPAEYMGWVSWPHFMGSLCLLNVLRQGGECSFLKPVLFMHWRSCPWCFVCHYCKSLCWACVHSFADVVIFGHLQGGDTVV